MVFLFFRNGFFILFLLATFSSTGFSARSDFRFCQKQVNSKNLFPENVSAKLELVRIVFEKGISKSRIFRDFVRANTIDDISFKYQFFPLEILKKQYTVEKGFTPDFVDDAIRGASLEEDCLVLMNIFHQHYYDDLNQAGNSLFPKIIEFIPNDSDMDKLLKTMERESHAPKHQSGLYLVSVFYHDHFYENKNSESIFLPDTTEILNSFSENSLRFENKEVFRFLGDKQKLIDMLFEQGVIQSELLKNFILGNNRDNILFYYNFQSTEDVKYILRTNGLNPDYVEHVMDDPHAYRFLLLENAEKHYCGDINKFSDTLRYHLSMGRDIDIKIAGLTEMLINSEDVRKNLFDGFVDNHESERGFYAIFVSFALQTNHSQTSQDGSELQTQIYLPYDVQPRMFFFEGDKNRLAQEVQSQGFSQSSIFQEFIDKNQIQNIEFKYCFISQKVLEKVILFETKQFPSVDDFISGNLTEFQRKYLKKEFYYDYLSDYDRFSKFNVRKYCNSKCRVFHPTIIELLIKNAHTTDLLTPGFSNLESERGVYLVAAFFDSVDLIAIYPHRRKLKKKLKIWGPNKKSFMDKLLPQTKEILGLSGINCQQGFGPSSHASEMLEREDLSLVSNEMNISAVVSPLDQVGSGHDSVDPTEFENTMNALKCQFIQRFKALEFLSILDGGEGESRCKAMGQEAFDAFKALGAVSSEAFELLQEVVEALREDLSDGYVRSRSVEYALDGVGDRNIVWYR
jgi:hypothetical protein